MGLNHGPLLRAFLSSSVPVWKAHLKTRLPGFSSSSISDQSSWICEDLPVLPVCPTLSSQESPEGAQWPQQSLRRGQQL